MQTIPHSLFLLFTLPLLLFVASLISPTLAQPNGIYAHSSLGIGWGATGMRSAFESIWGVGGFSEVLFSDPLSSILQPSFDGVLLLDGSGLDGQGQDLAAWLLSNDLALYLWVTDPSFERALFINNAGTQADNVTSPSFNFETFWGSPEIPAVETTDPYNPAFLGPILPTTTIMTGNFYAHMTVFFSSFNSPISILQSNVTGVSVLSYCYIGNRLIIGGGLTDPDYHQPKPASTNFFINLIYWAAFTPPPSVTSSSTPTTSLSFSTSGSYSVSLTPSSSVTATLTASSSPSSSVTASVTMTPSISLSSSSSSSPSLTSSITPSRTATPSITLSSSSSISHSSSVSSSTTPSVTPSSSVTPSPSSSSSTTLSATVSISFSASSSVTLSPTRSKSETPSFSLSSSITATVSKTTSPSDTRTPQKSASRSNKPTPTPPPSPPPSSPTPTSEPGDKEEFEDEDGEEVVVTLCPDPKLPYGCHGKCVNSLSLCVDEDVCEDPKDCPDSEPEKDNEVIQVDVIVPGDKEPIDVPVVGKGGGYVGTVKVPGGAFEKGTVIRVSSFTGKTPEEEKEDSCGKKEENEDSVRLSGLYDVTALSPKGKSSKFNKPVTIGQLAVLPKGTDPKDVCMAYNPGTSKDSKWTCEKEGVKYKKIGKNTYMFYRDYDHFTGFSVLLGDTAGDGCGGDFSILQWLSVAFLIGAGLVILVVCVIYYIHSRMKYTKTMQYVNGLHSGAEKDFS